MTSIFSKHRRGGDREKRRPCEDGCRDGSDVAINQEIPGITRARRDKQGFSPLALWRKSGPADTSVLYSDYLTIPTSKRDLASCF